MKNKRYEFLDELRGFSIFNMIIYHALWDLVNIFNCNWAWFDSVAVEIWQQFVCCIFIILSGFCVPLSKHSYKRGIVVFSAGIAVSAATIAVTPESRIIFGVLTLLGSCMLITKLTEPLLKKINRYIGFIISISLFLITKNIGNGYIGFGRLQIYHLPDFLYKNLFTAFIGFPSSNFYSTDYFPLLPWFFLFVSGYFLHHIFKQHNLFSHLSASRIKFLAWLGRHSLIIYMVHQPIIYFLLSLCF